MSVLLPRVPVMSLKVSSVTRVNIPATKWRITILRVWSPVKSGRYQYLEYQYLSLEVTIFAYRLILITLVPVPVISGIYFCPEFQLLSSEALASHLSQSTIHLRSLYFQYMPLCISNTISLSTCHKIVSEYDQEIPRSQTHGTTRKSHTTITRHQVDKLSKATSSLPHQDEGNLEWT